MQISHHEDGHDGQGNTNHLVHLLGPRDLARFWRCDSASVDARISCTQVEDVFGLEALDVLKVYLANLGLGVGRVLGEDRVNWPAHNLADGSHCASSAVLEKVSVGISCM